TRIRGDLARQVASRDGGGDVGNVSHLTGEARRHEVHVVGKVLPRPAYARHLRLSAESSFRSHFARHTRHFFSERTELIDHRVDGVLELEDFPLHIDGDLPRQVALRDRRGDVSDVSDLAGEVTSECVDVVGEILPRTGDTGYRCLAAKLSF